MVLALALAGSAASVAPTGLDAHGEWWTLGFNARVRIEACGNDAVCGRIVRLWDDKPKGIADKTPLVGKLVIDQMKPAEPGLWTGGRP